MSIWAQGTGVGLSTVYGIVHQSGGALVLESAEGKGTRVLVFLPRAPGSEFPSALRRFPHATARARARSLTHSRILLVDDQAALRLTMRQQLLDLGYTVIDIGDPLDAVAVLDRGEHIDLPLTDIVMPKMSGLELAARAPARRPPPARAVHDP